MKFSFYFKLTHIISEILIFLVPMMLIPLGIREFMEDNYLTSICCAIVLIGWIPLTLVSLGTIKYRGLSSKPIDLAAYEFNLETFNDNFKITDGECIHLGKILDKKRREKPSSTNLFTIAREIAVEENLDPRLYLALLGMVTTIAGERSGSNQGSPDLKERIMELKQKLEGHKKTDQPPTDSDKKYGFL